MTTSTLSKHFPHTSQDLDKVDAAMSCAMHNMKYRNPAEFTLVLTGERRAMFCCLRLRGVGKQCCAMCGERRVRTCAEG